MQSTPMQTGAACSRIENHPDYEIIKYVHDLKVRVLSRDLAAAQQVQRDLEATRWVSNLLTTIMRNTAQLNA